MATSEDRTSPERHRSRAKGQRGCCHDGRASVSRWSPRAGGEVAGPETSSGCSSVQLVPALRPPASLTAAPAAIAGGQASLLGPLPPLSSLTLQSAHSLLPPLRSHGAGVSRKMALRPRAISRSFRLTTIPPQSVQPGRLKSPGVRGKEAKGGKQGRSH